MLFCYICLRPQVIIAQEGDNAMTSTLTEQSIPTGTWALDKTHSQVGYAVKHAGVSVFRGGLAEFGAVLEDGTLRGSAPVSAITVEDENLAGHLASPDFFDAENTPQVAYTSTAIRRNGDEIVVDGELELRGVKLPVTLTGTISGPVDLGGT